MKRLHILTAGPSPHWSPRTCQAEVPGYTLIVKNTFFDMEARGLWTVPPQTCCILVLYFISYNFQTDVISRMILHDIIITHVCHSQMTDGSLLHMEIMELAAVHCQVRDDSGSRRRSSSEPPMPTLLSSEGSLGMLEYVR